MIRNKDADVTQLTLELTSVFLKKMSIRKQVSHVQTQLFLFCCPFYFCFWIVDVQMRALFPSFMRLFVCLLLLFPILH